MISPIRNYYTPCFKSTQRQPVPSKTQTRKEPLSYGHTLGVSALLGLSAMGFATIFCKGWLKPIAIGEIVAGISMLFSIPDRMNKR